MAETVKLDDEGAAPAAPSARMRAEAAMPNPYGLELRVTRDTCPDVSADCRRPGCVHTVEGDEAKAKP